MPASTPNRPYMGDTAVMVGGDVIRASRAALFLVNGLKILISDHDPETKVQAIVTAILSVHQAFGYEPADVGRWVPFEKSNARAVVSLVVMLAMFSPLLCLM